MIGLERERGTNSGVSPNAPLVMRGNERLDFGAQHRVATASIGEKGLAPRGVRSRAQRGRSR